MEPIETFLNREATRVGGRARSPEARACAEDAAMPAARDGWRRRLRRELAWLLAAKLAALALLWATFFRG